MVKRILLLLVFGMLVSSAQASIASYTSLGTASFTSRGSVDAQGDIDNVLDSWIAPNAGTVNSIRVTGSLTEVATATYASEARVRLSSGAGQSFTAFNVQASTVTSYVGTIAIGPTSINVTPFSLNAGGTVGFEWFESAQDGTAGVAEQIWDNVSYEFISSVVTNGGGALGTLTGNGVTVSTPGAHVSGGLDFYTFTFGGVNNPGDYLNISMLAGATGGMTDTEMALYDSLGNLVASSDDEGPGIFSELSYGTADPLAAPDLVAGLHGATLAAGTYTLVTAGYNTAFGSTIGSITPGTNAGTYALGITYVPEPASLVLLACSILAVSRRR